MGRDPAEIEVTCMWTPQMGLDSVKAFGDMGVSRLVVPLFAFGAGNPIKALDQFADDVINALA